ncbi:MAG: PAS domain-containing protein [Nitrosomonas sp.]|nr:PAS domain-containing protein [Nitrosomonas sp.]
MLQRSRLAATVFESIREGIVVTDLNRVSLHNRAYTEITGYSRLAGQESQDHPIRAYDKSFYQAMWSVSEEEATGGRNLESPQEW